MERHGHEKGDRRLRRSRYDARLARLWAGQPIYFQVLFALERVKALAPEHPEWRETEPFASLLRGDVKSAFADGEKSMMTIAIATHFGMTCDEFDQIVRDWMG